jgi:transcriptional adapter 2-beta
MCIYVSDLFAKYNCTYCQEDITGLRIKCAECTDFDLCLQVGQCLTKSGLRHARHVIGAMRVYGWSVVTSSGAQTSEP